MKNLLRIVTVLTLATFLFTSCTKDSLRKPETVSKNSNKITTNDIDPVNQVGAVQAVLVGDLTGVTMKVFNEDFSSDAVSPDDQGFMLIKDIPVGKYTVQINGPARDYDSRAGHNIEISPVKIIPDEITDLGTISWE